MGKKILFISGSPRQGSNTRIVMRRALEAARAAGAETAEIDAAKLGHRVAGCSGCLGCKRSGEFRCVIGDEVAQTVERLPEYDVVVFATPLYWLSWPAQLKILIDRMYSLIRFDREGITSPLKGKTLALIATGGGGNAGNLELLEEQFLCITKIIGARFKSLCLSQVPGGEGALAEDREALARAAEFGRELADNP